MGFCGQVPDGAGCLPRQRCPGEQGRGHYGRSGSYKVTGADHAAGAVDAACDVGDAEGEQECRHNAQQRAANGEGEPSGQQCGPFLSVHVHDPPRREDQEAEPSGEQMAADDFLEVVVREGLPATGCGSASGLR